MNWRLLSTLPLVAALAACGSLGPAFRSPAPSSSDLPPSVESWEPVSLEMFKDPVLSALVVQAQVDNPTLEQAKAKLQQARLTERGVQLSQGLSLAGQAGSSRTHAISTETSSSLAADASWQVDLFGAQRRQNEEMAALARSSEEQLRGARISLAAEVASTYADYRGCEVQGALALRARQVHQKLVQLTQAQYRVGTVALDAVLTAQSAVQQDQQQLLAQAQSCENDKLVLRSLTGLPMQSLVRRLQQGAGTLLQPPEETPLAVPAKVVLGRPDVAAAEQQMAAKSADISVQTAKALPSLSLVGNIGINTSSGTGGTLSSWSFGPTLTLPTLDPRVVSVTRQGAQAAYQAAYAAWRATVRAAALDVSKALVQLRIASAQYAAVSASASLAVEQHALTQARLSAGMATQLDLEQAQAAVLSARSAQVSAQLTQTQSWVALFKATASNLAGLTSPSYSTQ